MSDAPQPVDMEAFHTDLSVGEILRRTRVHYGQSLEDIGQVLRIRASQLEALETGHVEALPGRVYAIGFVRAYAEYLGLDGDKMVHLFKNQSVGKAARPDLHFPVAAAESKIPTWPIAAAGAALCLAVIIAGLVFFSGNETAEVIPSVPDGMQEQALSDAPSIIAASEPPPQPPPMFNEEAGAAPGAEGSSSPVQRVVIMIEDNSWVEVRDARGKVLVSQVLKKGDQFLVPNEPGMMLSTGNAGGITIKLDGRALSKLGDPAQVKRNISLNPSDLLKR